MATATQLTPQDALRAIIAAGVARYQESLPDYARDAAPLVALPDPARLLAQLAVPEPIISLNEETQRRFCLNCELDDCVEITDARCPIRREQRAIWREQKGVNR
jgi:hypothetical protein